MPLKQNCNCSQYPSHEMEMARLNRASGQLEGVKRMIMDKRYCPEILALLRGVRSALKAVESNILKRHLESCVTHSFANSGERGGKITKTINEIKEMLDRFN